MNANEVTDKKELVNKLTTARTSLLLNVPFYGTLLMHLRFGLASCGTACTDMKRILWDPEFLRRISLEEVQFVMLHEVMHCVLNHIFRGKGKIPILYNIAADIVVNSSIMQTYAVKEFYVDNEAVMHLAPDGTEGREYTAEQVYEMLLHKYEDELNDVNALCNEIEKEYGAKIDSHDIWDVLPLSKIRTDEWKQIIKVAAKKSFSQSDIPSFVRTLLDSEEYSPVIDWKQVLYDFIQVITNSFDFTFTPPDRRFSTSSFIFPSFYELDGEGIDNIWVLIDSSGSIDDTTLTVVLQELKSAAGQFSHFRIKISCFDTAVTEPIVFEDMEDLEWLKLEGGGGTSFQCIFDYLKENMITELPIAILIITDGCSCYPDENASMDVPVLWMLIDNEYDAPWGKSIHIQF